MKTSFVKLLSRLTGVATLMCALGLHAADLTWDADPFTAGIQDGTNYWNVTTNTWWDGANNVLWDNSTPANAIFGGSAISGTAGPVTVGASLTINVGNLTFNAPFSGNYSLTPGDANSRLSFTPSSIVTVASGLTITNTVILTGTSSFLKSGSGTFWLRPASPNLNTGTTIVTNGTLIIGSSGGRIVIPSDLIVTNSGDVRLGSGYTINSNTATVSVSSSSTFEMNGQPLSLNNLVLNGGTITQSGTEILSVSNLDVRSGSISQVGTGTGKLDVGTLTKSTPGTVTLTSRGSSSTTGGITNTVVNNGILILDYVQTSKLNDGGTVTVNGGTLAFTNGTSSETVGSVTLTNGVITNISGTVSFSVPATGFYDVRNGEIDTVLGGAAALTKTTSDTVILTGANSYTGGTVISGGTLQLGNGGAAGTAGSTTKAITDNAQLLFNCSDTALSISGAIGGSGSITKTGPGTVTLTGGNNYQGSTTISNGSISISGSSTLGDGTSAINLSGGTLNSTATRSVSSAPVSNPVNLTTDSAITTTSAAATVDLNFTNNSIGGTVGTLTLSNAAASGTGQFEPRFSGSGFTFSQPIVIANGVNGTTRLNSFNAGGTTQTFNGVISGNGGFRRSVSSGAGGVTIFNATNTYSGNTTNLGGTLLVNGTIGSGNVFIGSGGALGGNGIIYGPVTVYTNGTLSAGSGSIGVLTISNSLTFAGNSTNYAELNNSVPTNDLVCGITTVTYGGTLTVVNLGGTLALNNTFKLFDAANYTGSFSATNLPVLGTGLAWDASGLTNNGTIKVVSAGSATSPTLSVSQSGNSLTFSWIGSGFKLQSQTNSLAVGLNANWFDYPGGSSSPVVGVPVDPANPTVFFRLAPSP